LSTSSEEDCPVKVDIGSLSSEVLYMLFISGRGPAQTLDLLTWKGEVLN
jgi:hypothetical protein